MINLNAAGKIVISLKKTKLNLTEQRILPHKNIGGVILFARNFENKQQITKLVTIIKKLNKNILIMVDHEGGKVWRFNNKEFPNPGAMHTLGDLYNINSLDAVDKAYNFGYNIARDLLSCGIDLNLAPILDLGTKNSDGSYISTIIGNLGRAFHQDPVVVARLAASFIKGQQDAGMKSVGKHFPGHGSTESDTHLTTTIDLRSKQEIFSKDIEPFRLLITGDSSIDIKPNTLQAVMPAHIIYPAIDENPAGYSKMWLQNILRKQLNFNGIIISDCLSMKAIQDFLYQNQNRLEIKSIMTNLNITKKQAVNLIATTKALQAGCDLVIFNGLHGTDLLQLLNNLDLVNISSESTVS